MSTVRELAKRMEAALERKERPDKSHDLRLSGYVRLKDGSPDWMRDVARHAHDGMPPDDWKYEFIEDALSAITQGDAGSEPNEEDCQEALHEYIHTHQLTGWLHSDMTRFAYVDGAVQDCAGNQGVLGVLGLGMAEEQREVLGLVLKALRKVADEEEDE